MGARSLAAALLRVLAAAALVASAAGAACFNKGELCARSFVYTPCCAGLSCQGQGGFNANAVCK